MPDRLLTRRRVIAQGPAANWARDHIRAARDGGPRATCRRRSRGSRAG